MLLEVRSHRTWRPPSAGGSQIEVSSETPEASAYRMLITQSVPLSIQLTRGSLLFSNCLENRFLAHACGRPNVCERIRLSDFDIKQVNSSACKEQGYQSIGTFTDNRSAPIPLCITGVPGTQSCAYLVGTLNGLHEIQKGVPYSTLKYTLSDEVHAIQCVSATHAVLGLGDGSLALYSFKTGITDTTRSLVPGIQKTPIRQLLHHSRNEMIFALHGDFFIGLQYDLTSERFRTQESDAVLCHTLLHAPRLGSFCVLAHFKIPTLTFLTWVDKTNLLQFEWNPEQPEALRETNVAWLETFTSRDTCSDVTSTLASEDAVLLGDDSGTQSFSRMGTIQGLCTSKESDKGVAVIILSNTHILVQNYTVGRCLLVCSGSLQIIPLHHPFEDSVLMSLDRENYFLWCAGYHSTGHLALCAQNQSTGAVHSWHIAPKEAIAFSSDESAFEIEEKISDFRKHDRTIGSALGLRSQIETWRRIEIMNMLKMREFPFQEWTVFAEQIRSSSNLILRQSHVLDKTVEELRICIIGGHLGPNLPIFDFVSRTVEESFSATQETHENNIVGAYQRLIQSFPVLKPYEVRLKKCLSDDFSDWVRLELSSEMMSSMRSSLTSTDSLTYSLCALRHVQFLVDRSLSLRIQVLYVFCETYTSRTEMCRNLGWNVDEALLCTFLRQVDHDPSKMDPFTFDSAYGLPMSIFPLSLRRLCFGLVWNACMQCDGELKHLSKHAPTLNTRPYDTQATWTHSSHHAHAVQDFGSSRNKQPDWLIFRSHSTTILSPTEFHSPSTFFVALAGIVDKDIRIMLFALFASCLEKNSTVLFHTWIPHFGTDELLLCLGNDSLMKVLILLGRGDDKRAYEIAKRDDNATQSEAVCLRKVVEELGKRFS